MVQDGLVPPAADVVELQTSGECTREDQPEERVEKDLPRVERAGLFWCAETFLDPVQLQ